MPDENMSPALKLLDHVWTHNANTSWRLINEAMQVTIKLAITAGFKFFPDDFEAIRLSYHPQYWLNSEDCYSLACAGNHGPNRSAIRALERHLKREPFLCPENAHGKPLVRLHVGCRFGWHKNLALPVQVQVTSFSTIGETPCVVACGYLKIEEGKTAVWTRRPATIFRITHADIAAYRATITAHNKAQEAKAALPKPEGLEGMSPRERVRFLRRQIAEKREEARHAQ